MSHKTVHIRTILNRANKYLSLSGYDSSFRRGVIAILEEALHEADVYSGYGYIKSDGTGEMTTYVHGETDETRRHYYTHKNLQR